MCISKGLPVTAEEMLTGLKIRRNDLVNGESVRNWFSGFVPYAATDVQEQRARPLLAQFQQMRVRWVSRDLVTSDRARIGQDTSHNVSIRRDLNRLMVIRCAPCKAEAANTWIWMNLRHKPSSRKSEGSFFWKLTAYAFSCTAIICFLSSSSSVIPVACL